MDLPVVMGAVLTLSICFVVITILTDLIYYLLDPKQGFEFFIIRSIVYTLVLLFSLNLISFLKHIHMSDDKKIILECIKFPKLFQAENKL